MNFKGARELGEEAHKNHEADDEPRVTQSVQMGRINTLAEEITNAKMTHILDLARGKHSKVFFIDIDIMWTEYDHILSTEAFRLLGKEGCNYIGAFENSEHKTTIEASE